MLQEPCPSEGLRVMSTSDVRALPATRRFGFLSARVGSHSTSPQRETFENLPTFSCGRVVGRLRIAAGESFGR